MAVCQSSNHGSKLCNGLLMGVQLITYRLSLMLKSIWFLKKDSEPATSLFHTKRTPTDSNSITMFGMRSYCWLQFNTNYMQGLPLCKLQQKMYCITTRK